MPAKEDKSTRALDEATIVRAALRVMRRHGADKLSMRSLARELNVSPMALYHHVPSKSVLLDRMRDTVLARIELPEPSAQHWQAQLRDIAIASIDELSKYPGLLAPTGGGALTPGVRAMMAHLMAVLTTAGFEPREAALALTTYQTQLGGLVLQRSMQRAKAGRSRKVKSKGAAAEVGEELRGLSFQEALEFGVDVVLEGLRVRLERQQGAQDSAERAAEGAGRSPGGRGKSGVDKRN
ncbi:MAG: TetR family transcriptional regulator [Myxococcales bacterium]|nr:TetR family transcriptional regulator [Myxococcales bacterium]